MKGPSHQAHVMCTHMDDRVPDICRHVEDEWVSSASNTVMLGCPA